MKGNLLILGMGNGLGAHLLKLKADFDHVIGVCRTANTIEENKLIQIECDIAHIDPPVIEKIPGPISLVVYIASEWGESSDMLVEEYDRFTQTGPRGFLNTFQLLKNAGKLEKGALILSIGSISSQLALGRYAKSAYPINSTSKLLQKTLVSKLATCNPDYRFALLTLGSFEYLGYSAIVEAVSNLKSLSKVAQFSELELLPAGDIKDCE